MSGGGSVSPAGGYQSRPEVGWNAFLFKIFVIMNNL